MRKNSILKFLADRGVIISRQRAWIIGAICRSPVIPDVEQFWINLRRSKQVSWATTHSTFRVLNEMGIVEKFRHDRRNSGYKLNKMFYDQRDKR
ncbi:MAG: hypothetical protein ACTHZ1_07460 [Sphingobacterium sp.]